MSHSQLRVQLVVAAGIIGTSLLAATFTGCQSDPTNQAQASGAYGQYGRGPNGQQAANYGANQQPAMANASGNPNFYEQQNRQAFLNETQRLGAQPNLTPQDIVAMARTGASDQQIAVAVQQRGEYLRSTPGVAQYLAQNNVNPAVLGNASPITPVSAQFAAPAYPQNAAQNYQASTNPSQANPGPMNMVQGYPQNGPPGYPAGGQPAPGQGYPSGPFPNQAYPGQPYQNQAFPGQAPNYGGAPQSQPMAGPQTNSPFENGTPTTAGYPPVQADPGQVRSATLESAPAMPSFEAPAGSPGAAMPGQAWRPIQR